MVLWIPMVDAWGPTRCITRLRLPSQAERKSCPTIAHLHSYRVASRPQHAGVPSRAVPDKSVCGFSLLSALGACCCMPVGSEGLT